MADSTGANLDTVFAEMRAAYRRSPNPDWNERAARLQILEQLLRENERTIIDAIDSDFAGRPEEETRLLEFFPALTEIRDMLRHGHGWMRARRHMASLWFLPARTEIRPQPLGIVGIIAPWNYPLYLTVGPLANAVAAGNRCLLKLSEFAPNFAELFAQLLERHFPQGEIRAVTGDADVGRAFAALPFDHLLFTGSTAVGRDIMRAAAANLTPVTLELGGKSPAILGPDTRLEHAVERILVGKYFNAGQTCIAPDYVLLPRDKVDTFVDLSRRRFATLYPDFPSNDRYASIIDERHHARLLALREEALASGAHAEPLSDRDGVGRRPAPALFTGVDPECGLMQEEIFGPWLPLIPYDRFEEALEFIASRPSPLALYLFDTHARRREQVLERCPAGGVTVNDTLFHITQPRLPFGGTGPSGIGAYHGETGFRTFSRHTPLFLQSRWNGAGLLNPPYTRRFRWLLDRLLK